ncbi:MAG: hypothetical protein Edafosvirus24_3 [Edafosvirus sp.]|uniref:Uncharacterized protein n=1 Tax=Edafosvirus sp. TaxID=2487765 RepID=A0A3G4ZUU5_9VIRU|nr:MAG: hypothetical protein Edafosvirus24_3 [Edafosvirus sp.]
MNDPIIIVNESECMEMFPCKHNVSINSVDMKLNGIEIYKLLKTHNMKIPEHFYQYSKFLDKKLLTTDDIEISDTCLFSSQCQHYVKIEKGQSKLMNGRDIKKLFTDNNLVVPDHFKNYELLTNHFF